MHISEGILPLGQAAVYTAVAIPFLAKGVLEVKRKVKEEGNDFKALVGLAGSVVFVVSALAIPVPIAGTCAHPTGIGLAAILLGPWIAALIAGISLLLQALFLAHGGLTTWGANTLNMGIVAGFAAYGCFRLLRACGWPLWGAALAGLVGDLVCYFGTAWVMAVALASGSQILPATGMIFVAFLPTQIPLAILEAICTAAAVDFIRRRRPDIITRLKIMKLKEAAASE